MTGSNRGLLVRADASSQIGAGHVMRCLALSKAWQKTGGRAMFASAEMLPALRGRLRGEGIEVAAIEAQPGDDGDVQQTGDLASRLGVSWIVVDGYRFCPGYYQELKRRGLRSLAIDDDGRFEEYSADVVLNQNASACEAMYARRASHTRLLLGSRFVLLRPEFTRLKRDPRVPTVARRLLVTMGGSDPENVTLKVIEALGAIAEHEIEVRVVLGSGYSHRAELAAVVANLWTEVSVEENVSAMAPLMGWADLAVSAAGGTCWELVYMGVPAVVLAISRDQVGIAQAVAERQVARSLGWHADVSPAQIADAVCALMADSEGRSAMSRAGQQLVDGQGADRVVEFLQGAA
jgi:UDP-2,4-diacetamido-2,4,6-trideoxy-beta-L-altropyranose hydrolase